MDPHQKMHYLFHNLLRKLFVLIGHDIFREGEFKPYFHTYMVWLALALFFTGAVKTLAFYDLNAVLNVIGFIGIGFELVAKIYSVNHGRILVEVMDKITDIYAVNSKTDNRNRLLLINRFSLITEIVLKGGFALYCCAGGIYFIYPVYSYYFKNKLIPAMHIYIWFINENTVTGFICLAAIHILLIFLTVIGSACTDFMFIMIIVNIPLLSNIFNDNIRELNELLQSEPMDVLAVKAKLQNIILMHREIWDIIDILDTAFFRICFVQVFSAAGSLAVELFICLEIEFFPAVGLSASFLVQIIGFCAVGTIIEICNGQIYDSITRVDWFLLPRSDQRMYQFLMFNAQNTKALTIGGLTPLNMISCVSILKSIYTYLMILFQFID